MPRRLLTDEQRAILQTERSGKRYETHVTGEIGARERLTTEEFVAREGAHKRQRIETAESLPMASWRGNLKRRAADKVIETATPSTSANPVMLTIFISAGLIIFYRIVVNPLNFAGYLGRLQQSLTLISTTTPLFTQVRKTQ